MSANSKIEWTNDTWNPWQGCQKISPGCKFCYMYRDKKRYGQDPKTVVRSSPATFNAPLTKLRGPLVFTCSWSDFFIEQADEWRKEAWDIIRQTPHLTYQILTKRPENIGERLPSDWGNGWSNVWLGVSVESANYYSRLDTLLTIPAAVHFVSYEPALGPVNFAPWLANGLDWVISGGESDFKNPRPADTDWFRSVRDECLNFKIPYFHKQNGGNARINGTWGGRLIDSKEWKQFPAGVIFAAGTEAVLSEGEP